MSAWYYLFKNPYLLLPDLVKVASYVLIGYLILHLNGLLPFFQGLFPVEDFQMILEQNLVKIIFSLLSYVFVLFFLGVSLDSLKYAYLLEYYIII